MVLILVNALPVKYRVTIDPRVLMSLERMLGSSLTNFLLAGVGASGVEDGFADDEDIGLDDKSGLIFTLTQVSYLAKNGLKCAV